MKMHCNHPFKNFIATPLFHWLNSKSKIMLDRKTCITKTIHKFLDHIINKYIYRKLYFKRASNIYFCNNFITHLLKRPTKMLHELSKLF